MKILKNIIFTSVVLILFFLCCEVFLSFIDIDLKLLRKIIFYQVTDLEVHKVSDSPKRLYELRPGVSAQYDSDLHPKEVKYTTRSLTINSLGFRDQERSRAKKENVFRIIILGGSNTFGPTVSDEDTYPALMQKIFNTKYPGKIEVWNAGISAYMISQKVAYAESIIKTYNPDLLIFQNMNSGRRGFLENTTIEELKGFLKRNKELYTENLPLLFMNAPSLLNDVHYFLVLHSRIYRIFCISIYTFLRVYDPQNISDNISAKYNKAWEIYGDIVSERNFKIFVQKYNNIPIIVFGDNYLLKNCDVYENVEKFWFDNIQDKPDEYNEVHPPSYVYEWYAEELCDFLIENDYIPSF